MNYIESGKEQGATVHYGGERHGKEGYFISPTIFTDTKPSMKIVQEEIFGPVGVVIKFEDEEGEFDFLLSSGIDGLYPFIYHVRRHKTSERYRLWFGGGGLHPRYQSSDRDRA
jgi:hypothetical protein